MTGIDFSQVDLAFILDTTSSMGSYINCAKENIQKITEEIIKSEKCSLRIGLVNYRDHPPQDLTYVTEVHEFSDDINKIKQYINKTQACGGGDLPEAICCGMIDGLEKLDWRLNAVKVAILIADAPPHGLICSGDSMPNGCPLKNDPVEIAHKMAQKGITLYCAGCEPSLNPYRQFFISLCLITGGQYVTLNNAKYLTNVIIDGTREEISMEKMMAQIHNDIMREAAEKGTRVDEEELTKKVHEILNSKNNSVALKKIETGDKIEITNEIKEMSKLKNLSEIKKYASDNNVNLTTSHSFISPTPFSTSIFHSTKVSKKKREIKPKSKPTKKRLGTIKASVSLRRSLRIKELEERKKKATSLISDKIKTKRNPNLKINKKLKKDKLDDKTNVAKCISVDEEEKVDLTRARRLAKKVIARNF
ncbi:unnamed protein product [Brachionus calyciflorus]|uniref:VWFA domain-containing protein n=1 Tax=Brachionus calyciflorus TaxID=104777 RepID=A0A814EL61_9BILA|nr:unnamed protein product [Brachionus calyciflorus]